MISNFSFDGSAGIRVGDSHYDLHSFFSVLHLLIDPAAGSVVLELSSIEEFRTHTHEAKALRLVFSGVDYVEVSPGVCKGGSDTIEEIGFKAPNDRDDEWLKPTDRAEHSDHLFIRLSNLEFVRLSYSSARVEVR